MLSEKTVALRLLAVTVVMMSCAKDRFLRALRGGYFKAVRSEIGHEYFERRGLDIVDLQTRATTWR